MNNINIVPNPTEIILSKFSSLTNQGFNECELTSNELDFANFYKTGRPRKMGLSLFMEALDLKAKYTCETWKGIHRLMVDVGGLINKNNDSRFEKWNIPSYANFLKGLKTLTLFIVHNISLLLAINQIEFFRRKDRIALVDSSSLPACKVIRSSRHKTMRDFAEYSKSTMGWYYGVKLHLVCDYTARQRPLFIQFSNAKLDDRQVLATVMKSSIFRNTGTMFVADKGYLAKWLEDLAYETGNYLLTGKKTTKNMKVLASQFDIYRLRNRAKIETLFSRLKLNYFMSSTRSRSVLGYIFNCLNSIFTLLKA